MSQVIVLGSSGLVAVVDDADFGRLSQFRWRAQPSHGTYYAIRNLPRAGGRRRTSYMHREVLSLIPTDPLVDHANGDGLDNRRSNLRLADKMLNQANRRLTSARSVTSTFRGVAREGTHWRAHIDIRGRKHHLGMFDSEAAAALAYDFAAAEAWGTFARLNFPAQLSAGHAGLPLSCSTTGN